MDVIVLSPVAGKEFYQLRRSCNLTATCGQVTAADVISHTRCEFAVFAGGRKYAMRADTKFELDMWLEVCNRHGRMWLTDLSV